MKNLWMIFAAGLLVSVLVDLLVLKAHGDLPWSGVYGFFAVFGFLGCLAIVLVSKWLGHRWLQKKADYYERNDGDE